MPLDPYAPCPCGSGKKLKFCCADLATDIEKIHRMVEGEQPHAALRHVEQALAAHPNRASLLDLKATLELALDDLPAATSTVESFLAAHPSNPSALADRALLLARKGAAPSAVHALQEALAGLETDMPRRVLEAIGAVGHALLVAGHVVGAQAHLWLYTGIAPEDDSRGIELMMRLNQSGHLPLLLRERMMLREWPENVSWRDEALQATAFSDRGQWLRAVAIVDQLGQQHGADAALVYNRAVLGGWLADERALAAGLHAFARLDVPLEDAIEAEAIAQLIDPEAKEPTVDSVEQVYDVADLDKLVASLKADARAEPYEIDRTQRADDSPPPQDTFVLLDKPMPSTGATIVREDVPLVIGFVSVFGRQTDRAERLVLLTDKGQDFESAISALAEIGGDALGNMAEEKTVAKVSLTEQALSWRWLFPDDTPPALRRTLTATERHHAIVTRWPDVPRAALDGKSPREAKDVPELQIPLMAALLTLELGSNNVGQEQAFQELRDELGLPQPAPLDVSEEAALRAPVYKIVRLPVESISDEALIQLYRRAMMAAATAALGVTLRESLRRGTVSEHIPPEEAFQQLINMEEDPPAAKALLEKAREHCGGNKDADAAWDLLELELHLHEGDVDEAERMLKLISDKYKDDPEVSAAVFQVLSQAGLLRLGDAQAAAADEFAAAEPPREEGGIWTPDSERQSGDKSAIWTPS